MEGTKEKILQAALRLFARDGYEAVSVSRIAGELNITKGALYKHYKNKRDIFNHIFERICQLDEERAKAARVPDKTFAETPLPFGHTSADGVRAYMTAQFRYWTEDEFARSFRRMLTLEQYRNPELAALYQKAFAGGPVDYLEDLFREMAAQGTLLKGGPRQMAVELYAPFYLFLSISDASSGREEKEEIDRHFALHMERFMERYTEG